MKGNFNPFIAAWLPNVVFGALAWYLYRRNSRWCRVYFYVINLCKL